MDSILASVAQGQCASPGLLYSAYPYQVPDGHAGSPTYLATAPQYVPAGGFGTVLGQFGQPLGVGFSGVLGNPQLGGVLGGQYANPNPFTTGIQIPQLTQPNGLGFGQPMWLGSPSGAIPQPIGMGFGSIGLPQFGSVLGGIGSQIPASIPFAAQSLAAQQVAQQAAQAGQMAGQQAANQAAQVAAQQAAQQVACHAAQAAQQAAFQAAQAAQQVGQQAAQQVALQGAQQVGVLPAQQAA